MYTVSFTINDCNGLFTGRCCGIHFNDIVFVPNLLNGVIFKELSSKKIFLDETELSYKYSTTCGATWCADDYEFDFFNFKKLLNYLKKSKKWIIEESPSIVYDSFEKETVLTTEDIEQIIKGE